MTTTRMQRLVLASAAALLATGLAAASLMGPVGAGTLVYRTSPTTLNQLVGSDLAALLVAAPLALVVAVLVARGHQAGPLLATGVGVYAVYTYAQVIIGQEYLRLPGNVERFFPLLLAIFLLGEVLVVLGWRQTRPDLPPPSRRLERLTGWVLMLVAVFLVVGLHLPTMLTAWSDPTSMAEYASAPTPFWLVKLMDLGIVVPAAIATGAGLLRGAAWARRVMYPFLTGYAVLSTSVLSMALVMLVNDDPDAAVGLAAGFAVFTAALVALLVAWYRPLFSGAGSIAVADASTRPEEDGPGSSPDGRARASRRDRARAR
jgi:succinate dehydrogenase/fumarate reductase cytochrome b subunit